MIKKEVTYTDYFNNERRATCYFGFTKTELLMMQSSASGGLENTLRNIIETDNSEKIMKFFEKVILDSYGEKSDDGTRFMKNKEIRAAFRESPIFDQIFMELIQDENKAIEFVRGIMPKGINITEEDVKKVQQGQPLQPLPDTKNP